MVVGGRELIDTLWNVNVLNLSTVFVVAAGINRYIMECKYIPAKTVIATPVGINRYIMECKSALCHTDSSAMLRINRYIMECKYYL